MCGIAGALAFRNSNFEVTADYLAGMRDTMVHRGPDGAGLWVSPDHRVGLAHRRLSIIDLSQAAAQPMSNADGTLRIVFNGEIYNHAELRRELAACGRQVWQTDHSDTEVILQAFAEWGIACLQKFRGMFAFALWEARQRRLWLVRDRIGVKPLYYSLHNGRITFASEIKALLQDHDQKRVVDEEAFFHYLSFLTTPAPNTLFAGIRKLPAGSFLTVDAAGNYHEERYWDVLEHTAPLTGVAEEEIAERLLAELRTSVALRTVSDVPVGVFLSGGIDSSTNAALFSQCSAGPVNTFSVAYDRDYRGCRGHYAVPRHVLAKSIGAARRPRQHRPIFQIAPDIRGKIRSTCIAPLAVLLHCFHGDPVQIAAKRAGQLLLIRSAELRCVYRLLIGLCHSRTWAGRFVFPQLAQNLVDRFFGPGFAGKRHRAGQQRIHQHAQ